MKYRSVKILKYFLLLLFISYYGSITLFYHIHHLENGTIIVHSHLYNAFAKNQSAGQHDTVNHHHSANAYALIDLLSAFLSTFLFIAIIIAALRAAACYINSVKLSERFTNHIYPGLNGLRAPPLHILSGR